MLRVGGDKGSSPDHTTDGEDWFVLAVPAEMRDFLYAQLVELQDEKREPRVDREYVTFAGCGSTCSSAISSPLEEG